MKMVVRLVEWSAGIRQLVVSRAVLSGLLGLLVAGVAAPGGARAEPAEQSVYTRDGAYMGGRGIQVIEEFAGDAHAVEGGWGFGTHVGYRFLGYLAGEVDLEIIDPGFTVDGGALRNIGITFSAKAYPLALLPARGDWPDRFQPYAKAGIGMQYFYSKETDPFADGLPGPFSEVGFVARFGGGAEFYLSDRLAVTFDANYVITTGPIKGLNSWALGVIGFQWRFSR